MKVFFAIIISVLTLQLSAQVKFLAFNGTADSDYGTNVVQTADEGYMQVVQVQYEGQLMPVFVKTDCAGQVQWSKGLILGGESFGNQLITTPDNKVLVMLSFQQPGSGTHYTAVVKMDLNGSIEWSRAFAMRMGWENTAAVTVDHSNHFVICANVSTSLSYPHTGLLKLDGNGNVLQQARIRLMEHATPSGITTLLNGDYAIACTYPSWLPGFTDVGVVLTSPGFHIKNAKRFHTYYDDEAHSIASDGEGNIYIAGRSYFTGREWDAMLVKYDARLQHMFTRYYDAGTPGGEVFRSIARTKDNQLIVCGDVGAYDERNPVLAKISRTGTTMFSKVYPMSPMFTNYFFKANPTNDGGYVTTGDIRPPSAYRDGPILKTDAGGNDNCYAQDISFTPIDEAGEVIGIGWLYDTLLALSPIDTMPAEIAVDMHNYLTCGGICPGFAVEPLPACDSYCAMFTDNSAGATGWNWIFAGGTPAASTMQTPGTVCYDAPGIYNVSLTVNNGSHTYTIDKTVSITADCNPVFPNIITPNGDGVNDVFMIQHLPSEYTLAIFNRWGMELGQFKQGDKPWNGRFNNTAVADGTYFYVFTDNVSGAQYRGFVQVAY